VQDGFLDLTEIKEIDVEQSQIERYRLCPGDILLTEGGDRDKLGRGTLWEDQISLCLHQNHIFVVRANENIIFNKFLAYLFSSPIGKKYFLSCAKQSTNLASINSTQLRNFPLAFPSIHEQKAIAAILLTWDEAIQKMEQLIRLKKISFQELLSSRISSKSFKTRKLGKAIQEISQRNQAGITRVLSVTNHSGFVLPENQFERRVASQNLENYKVVCKGQYAYNPSRINVGSIARLNQWDIGVLSPMYIVFKIDETVIHSDFLYYWLQTKEARKRICASTQGSVRESVNFNDFANLIIPLPELKVQQKIIYELSLIESELNNLNKIREKLLLQKQGLMQKLLTGKWRVNFKEEK
jgi:type I restriction enzyme, S subunit